MAHPEEINKVAKVQTQARARARCVGAFKRGLSHSPPLRPKVSEVKEIMMQNIEKVLDRGEKLELLVDKTENLRYQADQFQKGGKALRNKMWWQNVKMKLMVALIVSIVIVVRMPVRTAYMHALPDALRQIIFCFACFSGGKNCVQKTKNMAGRKLLMQLL